jgi:hypothetical protein
MYFIGPQIKTKIGQGAAGINAASPGISFGAHPFTRFYILDACGKLVHEPDLESWANFGRSVSPARFWSRLSSLGVDHNYNFSGRSPPVLWETMIFGGPRDQYQERYSSHTAALK